MSYKSFLVQGNQVRLRNDPGRMGVLTGKVREQAGTQKYQVMFPDGKSYQPEYEIELVQDDHSDPWDLLEHRRFGRVSDLRRNLSHIQLSGRLANVVYSMDTTNTDFLAYQFKPVLSFLESPSNGLLIADEVGLGKTVEAGLIWTELRARYDARRLLVVCPAMLREKWRDELQERFAVAARICSAQELHEALRRNKHEIPDGQGIVCSLQGLRPPPPRDNDELEKKDNARRALAQYLAGHAGDDPLIDLLIIDEAHYLRNPESQTAKLGHLLRDVSENVVLLSATPINLRDDDLFHLLNLVDPDSFDVKEVFPQVLAANEPLQWARALALNTKATSLKIAEHLEKARSHPLLAENRQLQGLIGGGLDSYILADRADRIRLANRIERINLLRHAVNRTRKVEVTEWRVVRDPHSEFVELAPGSPERELYEKVTDAVRQYALRADISEGFLLATPQRQLSSCMYAAIQAWRNRGRHDLEELTYEDLGVEVSEDNIKISPLIEHLRRVVLPHVDVKRLRSNDSKYERFRGLVCKYLHEHPNEKVIVFSYFRGTLVYLCERLAEDGIESQVLVGGMRESKYDVINRFRGSSDQRVLLSSEVASEGVDLQFARVLVNYDLPWNPMKVEQRIGRIDRIGQSADKISIWNLCYANTIDHRIYDRLFDRLKIFERALGGMEAVLGEKVAKLTSDLLRNQLTPEQEEQRIDNTALAIEQIKKDQEELEQRASHLIAHSGYIMEQVQAARDFKKRITEDDLVAYVKDYLDRYAEGHQFKQINPNELIFRIKTPPKLAAALAEFIQKKKLFGQTCLANSQELVCRFLNKVRNPREHMECISQFHPLVRFISEDLKARNEAFYPLIAAEMDNDLEGITAPAVYAFTVKRWVFDGLRVEEELRSRIVSLGDEAIFDPDESLDLINRARLDARDWLAAANEVNLPALQRALDACEQQIDDDFAKARCDRDNENRDRVDFQVQSAQKHKDRQIYSLRQVLEGYRLHGRTRLIAATEGRIAKVKERFEVQAERLKKKSELKSHALDVCMGVIRIR